MIKSANKGLRKIQMVKILLVSKNGDLKSEFVNTLCQIGKTQVRMAASGKEALEFLQENKFDLAIAAESLPDMTGVSFVEKLVMINPMINTAIASDLSKKDFHEATEGLGVLMALPLDADEKDATYLLEYLGKIIN